MSTEMKSLFFEEREARKDGGPHRDDYASVTLRIQAFRINGVDPAWLDKIDLYAKAVVDGRIVNLTQEAQDYLLLKRDPSQTMDVRVCFAEEYGTWAEIVGATADSQAIRATITKLDKIWAVCEPLLKTFLDTYKPGAH